MIVVLNLSVGEGLAPPVIYKKSLRFARTTGGRPYRRCVVLSFLIVGDDILGVPSIKISFCLKGPSGTPVPTGFGENFDILLVGEDIILPPFEKIIVFGTGCRGSRLFGAMSLLAPSERGLPRKRVEEPAKQETVRLI